MGFDGYIMNPTLEYDIEKTNKYYPEMGKLGWYFYSNGSTEPNNTHCPEREKILMNTIDPDTYDTYYGAEMKGYRRSGICENYLYPIFVRTKNIEILKKINNIRPIIIPKILISRFDFMDI